MNRPTRILHDAIKTIGNWRYVSYAVITLIIGLTVLFVPALHVTEVEYARIIRVSILFSFLVSEIISRCVEHRVKKIVAEMLEEEVKNDTN